MQHVSSQDGTQLAYDRVGSGPPVILVGGALSDRNGSAKLAQLLAPHFTVISYDRRGRGDSGDTPPYSVDREIEDLAALIAKMGGSAAVFGMSSGAVLALKAADAGLPITYLALYEPPFVDDGSGTAPPKDAATKLTEMVAAGRRGDAVEYFMIKVVGAPQADVARMTKSPMWAMQEQLAHTLAYDVILLGNWAVPSADISDVAVPALVMGGESSPPKLRHAAAAVAAALPQARRHILKGQTHAVDEAVLAPMLIEFFQGNAGAGTVSRCLVPLCGDTERS
ncbi:MAG: alpha/beta hydrolase [Sphingosinicella sp.]|nr:alpha/beta hydrolase [Sphingosinicella sp.]